MHMRIIQRGLGDALCIAVESFVDFWYFTDNVISCMVHNAQETEYGAVAIKTHAN